MAVLNSSLVLTLVDRVTNASRGINASVNKLTSSIEANNRQITAVTGQFAVAAGAGYAFARGMAAPIQAAVDFESAMADVAKVSGFDDAGLEDFGKDLRRLAIGDIPLAVTELAALAEAAAQGGIADADLESFTVMTAKAAMAWGQTGAVAGENLAKIQTQLGLTIAEMTLYADAINHVADNGAANADDLTDFTRRVGAQGEFFGFSKEQTLAFGAAMVGAGAESEVAATSFRNMGRALTKGASATKRQSSAFNTLGMDSVKVAKAMQVDAVGTTMAVIEAVGQLPEHMQASVLTDLFGDEARALIPLVGRLDILRENLALVADEQEYAGSVQREYARRSETTAFQMQQFENRVRDLGITIGEILLPPLNDLMAVLGPIATRIGEFAAAHPELTKNVILATGALIGFRIAILGLKLAGLIGKGGALSALAVGMKGVAKAAAGMAAVGNAVGLQTALAGMAGVKFGPMAKLGVALRTIAGAVPGVSLIGAGLTAIGTAAATVSAPVWAALAAAVALIAGAGVMIWKYWDRISAVFGGVAKKIGEELQPALDACKPAIDWLSGVGDTIKTGWDGALGSLKAFGEWIGSFFQREVLSDEEKAAWGQTGYDIADSMINSVKTKIQELVDWFKGLPGMIMEAIGSIDIGSLIQWPQPPGWLAQLWGGGEQTAVSAVPSNLPARAMGGPVHRGMTALVGERGPEIVTFGTSGYVHPNGVIPRAPGMPSMGGGARQSAGPASISFGDIILQNPTNADPATISRMLGAEVQRRMQGQFNDSAVA